MKYTYAVVYRRVPNRGVLTHQVMDAKNPDEVIKFIRDIQPDGIESEIISIVRVG